VITDEPTGFAHVSGGAGKVTVRFWAGARRAAGVAEQPLAAPDLATLRQLLAARPALAPIMRVASLLVDGQSVDGNVQLSDGAVVDVLPPFAGG
jgi:sulfur-carrier protein